MKGLFERNQLGSIRVLVTSSVNVFDAEMFLIRVIGLAFQQRVAVLDTVCLKRGV